MAESSNIISSSVKVFNLLEILVEVNKATVSEMTRLTGFSQSTTQRILNTLRSLNLVDQDKLTNEYFPTFKLYELGNKVQKNIAVKEIAKPYLIELYNSTNETVNLGILDGDSVVYLDKLVSRSPIRVELEIGIRFPVYPSALGKAIVAFSRQKYSFKGKFTKYTEKTVGSDDELQEQLTTIRETGYSIDDEEYVKGLVCIGVPIQNKSGEAIASISVSMPKDRFDSEKIGAYVEKLNDCKYKIESRMFE